MNLYLVSGIMLKSTIQTEYISELEKVYIFTYGGKLLQLVPKGKNEIKPYDFLNNSNKNLKILEGETQAGNKIFFLNHNNKKTGL